MSRHFGKNWQELVQIEVVIILLNTKKGTPIFVTDIGDSLCWWQVPDADGGFEMLGTDFQIEKGISI